MKFAQPAPLYPDSLLFFDRPQIRVFENNKVFGRTNSLVKNNAFNSIFDYPMRIPNNDFLHNRYYIVEEAPVNQVRDVLETVTF